MQTSELLAKVRKIEIRTRRIVDEITGGAYHSVFKGRGIEFSEVREYVPGDDVRDIDWNVTARAGTPFIKKYSEERELNVMLAVDISPSGIFGSLHETKREQMIQAAALLSLSAIRNNDKVGLLLFSDRTELLLGPRSGRTHGLRLIRELLAAEGNGKTTDLDHPLQTLHSFLHKKTVIFLISDFQDSTKDYERSLKILGRKHDVIAMRVLDPSEVKLPGGSGFITLEGLEGASSLDFTASAQAYGLAAQQDLEKTSVLCRKAGVDLIDLRCGEDPVKALMDFFNKRSSRLKQ